MTTALTRARAARTKEVRPARAGGSGGREPDCVTKRLRPCVHGKQSSPKMLCSSWEGVLWEFPAGAAAETPHSQGKEAQV